MNKTDKIYDITDNLDYDTISELTNGLDMQKLTNINDNVIKNKNKKFVFKRLSFAASVALFTVIFGLVTMTIGIAANILVPRFFPGIGTVDVEPQAVRELAEPVYLENPEIYNVAIDYAAFIRNTNGSGTLLLEYTYLYDTVKLDEYARAVMVGDIIPDDDWEMPKAKINPNDITYTVEPCDLTANNDNLPCPEISEWTFKELRIKYDYESIANWSITNTVDDIEESEYYKISFDNGQIAVIQLVPTDYEPIQSLWTNETSGFKIRVTPYSRNALSFGFEIFPTEDWSDTVKFSIRSWGGTILNIKDMKVDDPENGWNIAKINGNAPEYPDRKYTDSGLDPRSEGFNANIPDNIYKNLYGKVLYGYNNYTVNYTENYKKYIENQIGAPIREYLSEGGWQSWADAEERYEEGDFKAQSVELCDISVDAVFDVKKARRQKITLPNGDGEINLNQEVIMKGLKYYIDKVRRDGNKIEIDITTEWDRILKEKGSLSFNEYADLKARVLMFATFGVDKYKYDVELRDWQSIKNRRTMIVVDCVGEKVKALDIYMLWAHFDQFDYWSVDISGLVE
jgi:hypothetical protein